MKTPALWLLFSACCIALQAFFSMMEMACISFSRIRLRYYVSQKKKKAIWLQTLLNRPLLLFGTTLIGANVMLQIGSECARRFYLSAGCSASWALLSQSIFVLLFAELSPMFAARKYSEHVAMIGIPFLYLASKIAWPLIGLLRFINWLTGKQEKKHSQNQPFLTKEELHRLFEPEEKTLIEKKCYLSALSINLLQAKERRITDFMQPIDASSIFSPSSSIQYLKEKENHYPLFLIGKSNPQTLLGFISYNDIACAPDEKSASALMHPLWVLSEEMTVIDALYQLHLNESSVATIIDRQGSTLLGIVLLENILKALFSTAVEEKQREKKHIVINREISGEMKTTTFNQLFKTDFDPQEGETMAQLITHHLQTHGEKGETCQIDGLKMTVKESGFLGPKIILIDSIL